MTSLSATDTSSANDDAVPRSVGRVLDLLEVVVAHRACSLTVAAEKTGLTPTTARRYLQALGARGYVRRSDAGEYTPGPMIRSMADALRQTDEVQLLAAVAQPHLRRLAAHTGESTYLALVDGDSATYVETAESSRAIRHAGGVGQRVPLAGTAVGAALASPGAPATRSGTVEPDIASVSLGLGGPWAGRAAVSVVGPAHRFTPQVTGEHEAALRAAVDALEHDLRRTPTDTDEGVTR